jgi:zinc protease
VSVYQSGAELGGTFEVTVTAKPEVGLGALEAAIRQEVAAVAREGVRAEELERALAQVESRFVQALERVGGFGGIADRLNEYLVFAGDPGFAPRDLARFERATTDALVEGARGWLVDRPGVTLSVVPEGRRDLAAEAA